jgi:hydrogenase maturation protein HypF
LALGDRVWPAPHLGDLQDRRCQGLLEEGLDALATRWGATVGAVLADRHPDGLGRQLAARRWPGPVRWIGVQHHLAHALGVVAEQHLELPLLALCADGLGYGVPELGHEPTLWGCELLWITASGAERLASLRPLPLPGGDRAQREPRRLALGLLAQLGAEGLDHPGARATLEAFAPAERMLLLRALATNLNCPLSSSLGRLFDAVASLLDLCQVLSHEGQGGLLLQGVAADHELTVNGAAANGPAANGPAANGPAANGPAAEPADPGKSPHALPLGGLHAYPLPLLPAPGLPLGWLDWRPLLRELLADRAQGQTQASCAARFHQGVSGGLVELLRQAAAPRGCRQVVLAGGCFQNALLLSLLLDQLRAVGLQPHWGEQLPCNDGGLAVGQIWAARLGLSITPAERHATDA